MVSWREKKPGRGVAGRDSGSDTSWALQAGTFCCVPSRAAGTRAARGATRTALRVFPLVFGGMESYREPFTNLVGKSVKSGERLYMFAVLWLAFLSAASVGAQQVRGCSPGCGAVRGTGTASREGKGSCLSPPTSIKCLFRSRAIAICQKKELIFGNLSVLWKAEPGKLAECQQIVPSSWWDAAQRCWGDKCSAGWVH